MVARRILIVGGSTRAAADSVRRAGWQPICADLFADLDLRHTAEVIPVRDYPASLPEDIAQVRADGWFYCGALENRPDILDRILARGDQYGPLLGTDPATVKCVRDPLWLAQTLCGAGIPALKIAHEQAAPVPDATWMQKPIASAGGRGVRIWDRAATANPFCEAHYFQQRITGVGLSALFRIEAGIINCVGICGELEDRTASRAPFPFAYCGSYGPIEPQHLKGEVIEQVTRLAAVLATNCPGLRGLIGLDFQWRDGIAWLMEVNPRYTASVEVLELAQRRSYLNPESRADSPGRDGPPQYPLFVVKQILYANHVLTVPDLSQYLPADDPWSLPLMADIPIPDSVIEPGWPICSILGSGETKAAAEVCLRDRTASFRALLDNMN